MKRTTSGGSVSPQRGPENKKPRLNSPNSNAFGQLPSPVKGKKKEEDGEWTKVAKRKQKKARNIEARMLVSAQDLVQPWFSSVAEQSTTVLLFEQRDYCKKGSCGDLSKAPYVSLAIRLTVIQDLRDLVIHLIGDGLPQSWLKVEVCFHIAISLAITKFALRMGLLFKK